MKIFFLFKKFVALTLITLLLPTIALAAQTLVYTDHEPLEGMRTRFIKSIFFASIEKESEGRLKIEEHWAGDLSNGYNALDTIQKGTADIGIVVPEYSPNDLPLHQIFKSFPLGPTGNKQLAFFQRVYTDIPEFPAELQKENVVLILFTTGYPVAFFSTEPLNNLEDIKEEKWRTASFWHRDFIKNSGGTPITIPWGEEVFKALQNKSLDGLMVNIDSGYDVNAQKVAPNVLVSKELWLGHAYLLVMNKDTWDNLAKEDKEAIQRAAETANKALGPIMNNNFDNLLGEMKQNGAKIRILGAQELNRWQIATKYQEIQSTWAKEQENKGVKDADTVMEKVRVIMADFVE